MVRGVLPVRVLARSLLAAAAFLLAVAAAAARGTHVATPGGLRASECVLEVPSGSLVEEHSGRRIKITHPVRGVWFHDAPEACQAEADRIAGRANRAGRARGLSLARPPSGPRAARWPGARGSCRARPVWSASGPMPGAWQGALPLSCGRPCGRPSVVPGRRGRRTLPMRARGVERTFGPTKSTRTWRIRGRSSMPLLGRGLFCQSVTKTMVKLAF